MVLWITVYSYSNEWFCRVRFAVRRIIIALITYKRKAVYVMHEVISLLINRYDFFLQLLWEHIEISLSASIIAIIIGGLLGVLIHEYKRLSGPVMLIVNFLYTIPSISMLGLLLYVSGVGNTTAIIALVIYALLPMVRNTFTGLDQIKSDMREAGIALGLTRLQRLWHIEIPLAMPTIMAGIRTMLVMTIALTGIASFIGAGGLGVAIYRGITTNQSVLTIAGSLLIALLAIVVDALFSLGERVARISPHMKRYTIIFLSVMTLMAMAVGGWSLYCRHVKADVIHIATKPMTEQLILGNALKELIEHKKGLTAEVTEGVGGGTSNIQPAMRSGQFDIYPEYTGTAWSAVLKRTDPYDESLFSELSQAYKQEYNFEWVGMYGFNNTYGIGVRNEIANTYGLKTYSDLARIAPSLTLGGEYDFFGREDGYAGLQRVYNMHFKATKDMDIGLKYAAISRGDVDVMPIFTTDGQLSVAPITVLQDDKHLYPSYMAGNVVRSEVLIAHPELRPVLESLNNTITDQDMAKMNYAVETEHQLPADVAHKFLVEHNLI